MTTKEPGPLPIYIFRLLTPSFYSVLIILNINLQFYGALVKKENVRIFVFLFECGGNCPLNWCLPLTTEVSFNTRK
jgi:hypothetical protein